MIGIIWRIPEELDDTALERKLFAPAGYNPPRSKPLPDWGHVHAELRRRGVTLALLWRNIAAIIPTATATAGSATFTSNGAMGSRRPCGRPTRPEVVEVRAAEATIEVFHRDTRIASHARSGVKRRHTTIPEQMPSAHR